MLDEIRRRVTGGFKPFTIFLTDGRRYDVPHPEFIMVTSRSLAVADKKGFIETLDPFHIVSVKDLATAGRGK
jgi:hypothetical protein